MFLAETAKLRSRSSCSDRLTYEAVNLIAES